MANMRDLRINPGKLTIRRAQVLYQSLSNSFSLNLVLFSIEVFLIRTGLVPIISSCCVHLDNDKTGKWIDKLE